MTRSSHASIASLALLLVCTLGTTESALGQAVVWSTWTDHPKRHTTLGPTGARGWVRDNRIFVVDVAPDSPAADRIKLHDAILGANGLKCAEDADPRRLLGKAITESETAQGKGRLSLMVRRDGKDVTVDVQLRVMGSYSDTWPYECKKSRKILHEASAYLAARQYPNGYFPAEVGISTSWAGLLFLATGESQYLDNARRAAYWLAEQSYPDMILHNWPAGYAGVFLAEYYLATGDRSVLPKLQSLCDFLAKGQMGFGSWAHNSPFGGYGAVNQVGLVCFMALVLADECGLDVDQAALKRSTDFFHKYAGKGWIPYGDHRPWRGLSGNGKNALAAVVFDLLGEYPEDVRQFSLTVAASYEHREHGHTGSFFSFFWGPLAAVHAGEDRFRKFLDEQTWYYDLARTHDGGLVNQPTGETATGYTWNGAVYTTGGMALFYALPLKTLRILGAEKGPFDDNAVGEIAPLVKLYQQREWDALQTQSTELIGGDRLSAKQKSQVKRLQSIAATHRQSVALTLRAIRAAVDDEDAYRGAEMLACLERLLGKNCPELVDARQLIDAYQSEVAYGRRYYKLWSDLVYCAGDFWLPYGKRAMREVGTMGPLAPKPWHTLAETSEEQKQDWRVLRVSGQVVQPEAVKPPTAAQTHWQQSGFDDSQWLQETGPFQVRPNRNAPSKDTTIYLRRTFEIENPDFDALRLCFAANSRRQITDVYLNGVPVAQLYDSSGRVYAKVALRPEACPALRRGTNCLAVRCHNDDGRGLAIDVGLQGARP